MTTQKFGANLKRGDAVVVPYGNRLWPAIFLDFGPRGNARFHLVNAEKNKFIREKLEKGKKPYVDYITRDVDNTIAKINPSDCTEQVQNDFQELYSLFANKNYL